MDWQSINQDYVLIAIASGSFMAGVVFTRLALRSGKRAVASEDRRDHLIRQLEADLRLAKRQLEEYAVQVETKTQECDQSMATVFDLNALLDQRNNEVASLRNDVKGAVKKTHELRRELTNRAEETLREHVRAEEARTELDVVRAGSDAIVSEFARYQKRDDDTFDGPAQPDLLADDIMRDDA